ncbi:hypothetical protein AVEN_99941-1 [Araneus ventricosus]|uniref:Uncharacterized protein n=1 Tax=Araneus ventricosus TaxID=182803 RepID=A0A4Y2H169_ARAVE|nr:hypothetical protein AVEN_99941-1 [Araneus ventricosus]
MLSSSLRAYLAKDWLSVFTGTRLPSKYRISSSDLTSKSPITRTEIRIEIRLLIQSRLNLLVSRLRLSNSNLKSPLTIPSEAWPKCYVFVICPVVDCGHQQQTLVFSLLLSFAED